MEAEHHEELEQLNQLYKENNELYHHIAVKLGMSDSAFSILYAICELGDGCLQKDICRRAFLSKQTVHSSIRNLERDGLLYLEHGRRRDMHIHLTEAGARLARSRIAPIFRMEQSAFLEMDAEEQQALLRSAKKYADLFRRKVEKFLKETNKEDL